MYDLAELKAATDAWWNGLARAFTREGIKDVPDLLDRSGDYRDSWTRPELLLGQTCGYPLTHELREKVALVATPCYRAYGCEGHRYASIIIVHTDAPARDLCGFRGKRCVVSNPASHSGYNAFRHAVAPLADQKPFFGSVVFSGSHLKSVHMVSTGEAEVTAIDSVTFALLARHNPSALAAVRPLGLTALAPGLPYITSTRADADTIKRLKAGLVSACHDPALAECRAALLIDGFSFLSLADYDRVDEMEREAIASGYPVVS